MIQLDIFDLIKFTTLCVHINFIYIYFPCGTVANTETLVMCTLAVAVGETPRSVKYFITSMVAPPRAAAWRTVRSV